MARWNDEQTLQFIKLYQYHSCLWQTDSSAYKNRDARTAALETIVSEMEISGFGILECKNKIKNIRSHYCQELKKIYDSQRGGVLGDAVYKPRLFWFAIVDGFLRKYVQSSSHSNIKPNKKDTQSQNPGQETDDDIDDSETLPISDTINVNQNCEARKLERIYSSSSEDSDLGDRASKRRRRNPDTSPYLDRLQQPVFSAVDSRRETEFDVFGKSVAAQLNNMHFAKAMQLQLKIQTLITEERLKDFMS